MSPISQNTQSQSHPSVAILKSPADLKGAHISGAHIFLQALVDAGVDTVFGLPGGVILPIYEALPDYPLNHILVRHEQGATHMAEGYARSTGKPGVVLVTSGPGATNVITGLTDAYYDSVPLIVFTGNVTSTLLGNDAFQEADIVGMTRACTKHNVIVRNVEDLAQAVKEAFYVATSGRPGPVLVDITRDVLVAKAPYHRDAVHINLPGFVSRETPVEEETLDQKLHQLLELLAHCRKPVLLSGGGVITAGAYDEVFQFAELFNIPVASSLMGLGGFPCSHPLSLGFAGMHGHYATNIAIAEADLLLVVGNRLNERQTGNPNRFAKQAKIVHFDLDPTTLEKNVDTFLPIQGDLKRVFQKLLTKMTQTPDSMSLFQESLASRSQWLETIEGFKRRRKNDSDIGNDLEPEKVGGFPTLLTPQWVIERLYQWLPANAFVTTEVGQHQMWAAQRFNLDRPRSFISSGGLGTMGFGFPAAIGIQVAHPEATVLDIAGDGSFQMTLQELATAMDHRLPVKVAIINNGHLGMIRQWQGKMYTRESQAKLSSPDYVKLAEAYGCQGFEIVDPTSADEVIQKAYAIRDRPVIMNFRVQSKEDVYPWVPAGASNEEMLVKPG